MSKWKKAGALLMAAAMFLTLSVTRGTLAYYTVVGTATNVVTSGNIQLKIHEMTKDGTPFPSEGIKVFPGDKVSKEVTVENTCAQPFFLRIRLTNGIEGPQEPVENVFAFETNTADWTLREDGCYYYNKVLEPGQRTTPLFKEVEMVWEQMHGRFFGQTLTLTVTAEAVQSKNNPVNHPWEAQGWPEAKGGQA
ncbi:MAG: hypothetical protein IKA78_05950 [Oscillospiraceae bacterium]|nr:hypothetical protein [Oscillospiraceae bacterium]